MKAIAESLADWVKRVYEALYAKVLVGDADLLRPQPRNLTRGTRAFVCQLFPQQM
jgi:hypothetical protein